MASALKRVLQKKKDADQLLHVSSEDDSDSQQSGSGKSEEKSSDKSGDDSPLMHAGQKRKR